MFLSGDEFLNTQYGNNNAYCQDNEISWLNWEDINRNREHFEFCRYLIQFRKDHPVIRRKHGENSYGYHEMETFLPDGSSKALGILYAGKAACDGENVCDKESLRGGENVCDKESSRGGKSPCDKENSPGSKEAAPDDYVYLAVNVYWESQRHRLPALPPGYVWQPAVDSYSGQCGGALKPGRMISDGTLTLLDRSVCVLTAVRLTVGPASSHRRT